MRCLLLWGVGYSFQSLPLTPFSFLLFISFTTGLFVGLSETVARSARFFRVEANASRAARTASIRRGDCGSNFSPPRFRGRDRMSSTYSSRVHAPEARRSEERR